jgi:hypothetical protein
VENSFLSASRCTHCKLVLSLTPRPSPMRPAWHRSAGEFVRPHSFLNIWFDQASNRLQAGPSTTAPHCGYRREARGGFNGGVISAKVVEQRQISEMGQKLTCRSGRFWRRPQLVGATL